MKATIEDIKQARLVLLEASGVCNFMDVRDLLDKRFPDVSFTLEEENDLWLSLPKKYGNDS